MTITRIGIYCRQAFFLSAVVTFAACANSPAADGGGQGEAGARLQPARMEVPAARIAAARTPAAQRPAARTAAARRIAPAA